MEHFNIAQKYKSAIPAKPDPIKDGKLRDVYAVKSSGTLLDVGCSVGDFLHKAQYFYEVEGIEVNPHTAAVAEQYFTSHKKFLVVLNLGSRFDVFTLRQILYGVPDPVQLLGDIHKVLKPDGILYINTPNADSYAMELYQGQCCQLYGYTLLNVIQRKSAKCLGRARGISGVVLQDTMAGYLLN